MSEWERQFRRVLRALERLNGPHSGEAAEIDDLDFFFQNCWHLKDWIKNDDSLPQGTRDAIVKEAENIENLKFCADLANGSKHLKLGRFEGKGAALYTIASITNAKTNEVFVVSEGDFRMGYVIASKQGGAPRSCDAMVSQKHVFRTGRIYWRSTD